MDNKEYILKVPILLLTAILSCVLPVQAETWVKAKSAHFTVISNGSEKQARQVAFGFEQIHAVFASLFKGFRTESGSETLVFATKDERTFSEMLPSMKNWVAGAYAQGWEKDHVVVRLDRPDQTRSIVYHEYVHKLLHLNFTRLPVWLDEGLAEFYANTEFQGNQTLVGTPSPRMPLLQQRTLIPLQTILSVNERSPYYHDEDKVQMFYAESWGLTHFLMFGKGMGNGEQMKTYLTLLQQKKDSVEAFEQSFGKLDQLNEQFEKYLRTFQLKAMAYNTPLGIDPATIPTGPMPVAETDARMGDFFNYLGSSDKAEEWLKAALAADSKSALAHENMGFAEFREGNDEEAEKEFDEAVMLAPDSYLAVYYQAMLRYQRKTDAESLTKLDAAMGQVMQLNPFFAPPFIERSEIYVKEGKLQDAFNVALQGQKLEPDRAGYVTRMAAILLLGHNYPAAVKTGSLVVSRWTYNDGAEAIAVINEARRVGKIEPTTEEQALENDEMKYAKDTMAAEGEVKSVSCEKSKPIELVLQNGDQEFEFQGGQYGAGFTDTLWYGKDHFNPCHHIEGLRAVVRYKLSADQPPKNEMKWLEIRDSLVPNSVPAPAN